MSAPPPGRPNGAPRPPQRANPLRPMRKKAANPLVQARRPPPKAGPPTSTGKPQRPTGPNGQQQSLDERRRMNGGWSEPPPPTFQDIPIMTTKRQLMDGMRFHLMKFAQAKVTDKPVDPTDGEDFARPVTLHRRDARQPPPGRAPKVEVPEAIPVDEAERARHAQMREEKEAQRAIDQAKIAPIAKDANPKPKQPPSQKKKKGKEDKTMFQRSFKTDAAKKESEIRYEEALPWHLEDADGKNVWVGSYVAALSEHTVAFQIEGSVFRMIPVEKWYKFTSKPPFQAFTIEQAEAFMNRKVDVGRWVMKSEESKANQAELEATRNYLYGRGRMVKTESSTFRAASRAEKMEHDELDVSGDEFQDDDEAPTFERGQEDEDTKDSTNRIRREQLGANLFGDGDEQVVDKELQQELQEELDRKHFGKTTKKALIKRDREDIYESDNSEDNPWLSSSESSDDDENEEEQEKDSQADGKEKDKDADKDKSSKGSTPKGKQKATAEPTKKGKGLKRAGSPALSESSGNESTRKKKLKKTATPATGSRAGTPSLQQQAVKRKAKTGGAGSGSDGEATAGEMSDGAGPKKKIKVVGGSARATPTPSRAGSPSRAASPLAQDSASPPGAGSPSPPGWVTAAEVLEQVPASGIDIYNLIRLFQSRLGDTPGLMPKSEWIDMVKRLCIRGPDKLLRRK